MFQKHGKPGLFIVVEGTDGAGTTSVTNAMTSALWQKLNQYSAQTSEPSDPAGSIGSLIRDMLNKKSFSSCLEGGRTPHAELDHFGTMLRLLFAADRFDHIDRTINPLLESGQIVVCDRYVYSSMVYQGSWHGPMSGPLWKDHAPTQLERVIESNRGVLEPDMVLFLDVDADVAFERINRRNKETMAVYEERDVFETREKVKRHADLYRKTFELVDMMELHESCVVHRIDANEPFERVFSMCFGYVKLLVESSSE